jgi:hypothetical protein
LALLDRIRLEVTAMHGMSHKQKIVERSLVQGLRLASAPEERVSAVHESIVSLSPVTGWFTRVLHILDVCTGKGRSRKDYHPGRRTGWLSNRLWRTQPQRWASWPDPSELSCLWRVAVK